MQIWLIPALLIWCLNKFSVDTGDGGTHRVSKALFNATWTWDRKESLKDWIFGPNGLLQHCLVGSWDKFLSYSTPVFQVAEGFCSLLVIQAAGQVTRYLVNSGDGGDGWMIGLLLLSGSVISSSVYFLWRITTFQGIDSQDAMLIGMAIACAIFLCAWGMGSGRGNVVESSLLFAYITLCIYQIFTDYQPSNPTAHPSPPPNATDFPPLPPIIMASYTTALQALSSLPSTLHSAFGFMISAIQTITPSVIVSLSYRLTVLYMAARIVPAIRESGAQALSEGTDSLSDSSEPVSTMLGLLSYYSASILIAVYTSLLMQHFASAASDHPGEWWTSQGGEGGGNISRWINLAGTMGLYAVELWLGKGDDYGGHWKLD